MALADGRTVLGLIPARGGSKGVPRKNVRCVGGRRLVERAVDTALCVNRLDDVVVSTDDAEIEALAVKAGAHIIRRPPKLANDTALAIDVIRHALTAIEDKFEVLVLLQPTSPLREPQDVDDCLDALDDGCHSAATFTRVHPDPRQLWLIEDGNPRPIIEGLQGNWFRRQDAIECFCLNGAVYAFPAAAVWKGNDLLPRRCAAVVMPPWRSIDVDDPFDLAVASMAATTAPEIRDQW